MLAACNRLFSYLTEFNIIICMFILFLFRSINIILKLYSQHEIHSIVLKFFLFLINVFIYSFKLFSICSLRSINNIRDVERITLESFSMFLASHSASTSLPTTTAVCYCRSRKRRNVFHRDRHR